MSVRPEDADREFDTWCVLHGRLVRAHEGGKLDGSCVQRLRTVIPSTATPR